MTEDKDGPRGGFDIRVSEAWGMNTVVFINKRGEIVGTILNIGDPSPTSRPSEDRDTRG